MAFEENQITDLRVTDDDGLRVSLVRLIIDNPVFTDKGYFSLAGDKVNWIGGLFIHNNTGHFTCPNLNGRVFSADIHNASINVPGGLLRRNSDVELCAFYPALA